MAAALRERSQLVLIIVAVLLVEARVQGIRACQAVAVAVVSVLEVVRVRAGAGIHPTLLYDAAEAVHDCKKGTFYFLPPADRIRKALPRAAQSRMSRFLLPMRTI